MNTSKCHYCNEAEQRETLVAVFTRFAGSRKGPSGGNIPFQREGMTD